MQKLLVANDSVFVLVGLAHDLATYALWHIHSQLGHLLLQLFKADASSLISIEVAEYWFEIVLLLTVLLLNPTGQKFVIGNFSTLAHV